MKKYLTLIFIPVIIVTTILGYWLYNNIDEILRKKLETKATLITEKIVTVGSLETEIVSGIVNMDNIEIKNNNENIIKIKKLKIKSDISKLGKSVKVIDSVIISDSIVYIDVDKNKKFYLNKTNNTNLKNIKSLGSFNINITDEQNKLYGSHKNKLSKKDYKVSLKKLTVNNTEITIDLNNLNRRVYKTKIDKIVITNIGGKNGIHPNKISDLIVNSISKVLWAEIQIQFKKELNKKIKNELTNAQQQLKEQVKDEVNSNLKSILKSIF